MRDKHFILSEIRRTALLNGGQPLGQRGFKTSTGIARHEWLGRYWTRWPDAVLEAGLKPLEASAAFSVEEMLDELAKLVRKYRRFPIEAEILIEKRGNGNERIPSPDILRSGLGRKQEAIRKLRDYCSSREEYADVSAILAQENIGADSEGGVTESKIGARKLKPSGHVYLVKSGRLYKVGQSANRWQRVNQLDKQTSEGIDEVIHTIAAIDDAPGIERYWHERFKERRQHGEWFDLSAEDISAFKKRKFM
jgi:hypothetical protein